MDKKSFKSTLTSIAIAAILLLTLTFSFFRLQKTMPQAIKRATNSDSAAGITNIILLVITLALGISFIVVGSIQAAKLSFLKKDRYIYALAILGIFFVPILYVVAGIILVKRDSIVSELVDEENEAIEV